MDGVSINQAGQRTTGFICGACGDFCAADREAGELLCYNFACDASPFWLKRPVFDVHFYEKPCRLPRVIATVFGTRRLILPNPGPLTVTLRDATERARRAPWDLSLSTITESSYYAQLRRAGIHPRRRIFAS